MKKDEMVKLLSFICDCNKVKAAHAVESLFRTIRDDSESTSIRGFGTFKRVERKARKCRDPRNGETVIVPARTAFVFKESK